MKRIFCSWQSALLFSTLLWSCQSSNSPEVTGVLPELAQDSGDDQPFKYDSAEKGKKPAFVEENLEDDSEKLEESAEEISPEEEDYVHSLPTSTPEHDRSQFPFVMNDRVQKWIDYFSKKDRERFMRFMQRGAKYRATIEDILVKEGLPKELYYLAFIESGFSNHARSHASAVGVWQFIKGTAKRYDLRVDRSVDERSDLLRSTYAAARYLRDLFRVYQDWNLAMASYNAGEGRILGGIMRSSHRDYWLLVDKKLLPPETADYVPKVIAAALIGQNPSRYNFPEVTNAPKWDVKAIRVAGRQSLATIASKHGMSRETLLAYNPHLRSGYTPSGRAHYNIWIPQEGSDAHIAEIIEEEVVAAEKEAPVAEVAVKTPSGETYHRVRKGENLAMIAKRYGVSVHALKSINRSRVRGSTIYPGARLKIPDGNTMVASRKSSLKAKNQTRVVYHLVRRGENLTKIAKRYGVGIQDIRRENQKKVRKNTVMAGTRLKIVMRDHHLARES